MFAYVQLNLYREKRALLVCKTVSREFCIILLNILLAVYQIILKYKSRVAFGSPIKTVLLLYIYITLLQNIIVQSADHKHIAFYISMVRILNVYHHTFSVHYHIIAFWPYVYHTFTLIRSVYYMLKSYFHRPLFYSHAISVFILLF